MRYPGLFLRLAKAVVALCACLLMNSTLAATHALLVGVSGYPALPENRRLSGPANDVRLMRDSLLRMGVTDSRMTLLADGVAQSTALPTRANILSQLEIIPQKVRKDDWVILYFSGHGSQQPQFHPLNGYIEPDGLDEIFLAYDADGWDGKKHTVKNAIIDNEFDIAIAKITQKGAYVWAIFDTCHAAGMGKAISFSADGTEFPVWRYISPSELGIPSELMHRAAGARTGQTRLGTKSPTFFGTKSTPTRFVTTAHSVAFYASHKDEPAAEESFSSPLSGGILPAKARFGVFTYHLASTLPQWQGSFQELAKKVAERYQQDRRPFPTPLFEGALEHSKPFIP